MLTSKLDSAPDTGPHRWQLPGLSLAERDRRWALVRGLMREEGIDCLLALNGTGQQYRNAADGKYLTQLGQNSEEFSVVFPLEGAVRVFSNPPGDWPNGEWVGPTSGGGLRAVIATLEDGGFGRATIGVTGLSGGVYGTVRQSEGYVPHGVMERLARALPSARFVNAADLVGKARYVKSAEEIDFLRRGTAIAERALYALLETARVGAFEPAVMAAMLQAEVAAGGSLPIHARVGFGSVWRGTPPPGATNASAHPGRRLPDG